MLQPRAEGARLHHHGPAAARGAGSCLAVLGGRGGMRNSLHIKH